MINFKGDLMDFITADWSACVRVSQNGRSRHCTPSGSYIGHIGYLPRLLHKKMTYSKSSALYVCILLACLCKMLEQSSMTNLGRVRLKMQNKIKSDSTVFSRCDSQYTPPPQSFNQKSIYIIKTNKNSRNVYLYSYCNAFYMCCITLQTNSRLLGALPALLAGIPINGIGRFCFYDWEWQWKFQSSYFYVCLCILFECLVTKQGSVILSYELVNNPCNSS